jgi:hypothetical protein
MMFANVRSTKYCVRSTEYCVLSKRLQMMLYEQIDCLANSPEVCRVVSSKHIDKFCTGNTLGQTVTLLACSEEQLSWTPTYKLDMDFCSCLRFSVQKFGEHFKIMHDLLLSSNPSRRSRVRFPMGSLGFFIELILSAALWP